MKLLTGEDEEVRAAVLKVAGPGRAENQLQQPIQRLYPLETPSQQNLIRITTEPGTSTQTSKSEEPSQEDTVRITVSQQTSDIMNSTPLLRTTRTPRRAALKARDHVLAQTIEKEISE